MSRSPAADPNGALPPSAPVSAAAPAQASIKTVASGQLPVASEGKLRSNGILLECQEKPGRTFTASEVADLARVDRHKVSVALSPSGMRSREWAPIGAFHFKRSSTTLSPPTPPPIKNHVGAAPMNYESKPRERGNLSPINSHLVGGAARITHADPG
jgi:hypothetical protein